MKSVLLAYLYNGKICISRSFDIIDNKLNYIDEKSEYPFIKSVGLPVNLYNSKKNNDIFTVEWDVSENDFGKLESYCVNDNIEERIYEVIDINGCENSTDVINTLKEGFTFDIDLSDIFFIKSGRASTNAFEVFLCEKKLFTVDGDIVKLKDKYMGKPIVKLERRYIPKTDIISLNNPNSEYDREFYLYTNLEKLRGTEYFLINDGTDLMMDYFYQAIKNRRTGLDMTKKETQSFTESIRNVLKENDNIRDYLIDLGYPEKNVDEIIVNCEMAIEAVILNNDRNSEMIERVILTSSEIQKKYYPLIEEKYIEQAKNKAQEYENEIQLKEESINSIKEEIKTLEKEKEDVVKEVNKAKKQLKEVSEEINKFGTEFEKRIKDYIDTDTYLKKILGGTTVSMSSNVVSQTCVYKTINFDDVVNEKSSSMKELGIPQKDSVDFINCIANNLYANKHFLLDSVYSEKFAKFMGFFIGKNSYDVLYIDNQTTINEITNVVEDNKKIVLVKNALRIIDTNVVEYLSNNYKNTIFIFEVDDVMNIKYYPKKLWDKVFYFYYGHRKGSVGNTSLLSIPTPKEYFDFSSNIDMTAEAMNVSVDDEDMLGEFKVEITKQINSMYFYDKKFNYFYAPHISILLNSYGIDISELRLEDSNLEKYITDLVKE